MIEILIVEHDLSVRELVAELLCYEGFAVTMAADASAAMAQREQATPAALLLEARPGDGEIHWLVRRCRAQARLAEVPIIVMTTSAWNDPEGELGVAAVIMKPFDIDELVETVKRATSEQPGRRVALVG